MEDNGFIYAPWIPQTTATFINGVRVWDRRWYVNLFCEINWFFHFRLRKNHKKYLNKKISELYENKIVETASQKSK